MEKRHIGVELTNGNISGYFKYKNVKDLLKDIMFLLMFFGVGGYTYTTHQSLGELTVKITECETRQANLVEKVTEDKARINELETRLQVTIQTRTTQPHPKIVSTPPGLPRLEACISSQSTCKAQ